MEVCDDNIYYKKGKKRRKKTARRFFCFVIVIILIVGFFLYYKNVISNELISVIESKTYSLSTESVNRAVLESLSDNVKYSDLVTIEKDTDGNIVLISVNPVKTNVINKEVAENTQVKLKKSLKNGVKIPILAFTGLKFLVGYGSEIDFKTLEVSSCVCDFKSTFKSVSINQTLHSIYLVVKTQIDVLIPLNKKSVFSETEILLSESVIVGKIPDFYLNTK